MTERTSASSRQCASPFYSSRARFPFFFFFLQSITSPRPVSPATAQIWLPATSGSFQSYNRRWKGGDLWMRRSHSTQAQSTASHCRLTNPTKSECSRMHSKVSSDWLPSYIKATRPFSRHSEWTDTFRTALVKNPLISFVLRHEAHHLQSCLTATGTTSGNFRQQCPRVLISHITANTDIVRILKTYNSKHRTTLWRLQKKSAKTFLSHAPPFPKEICFLEGSHASRFWLLVRATRRWKWVWRMNAATLTEANRNTRRKTCPVPPLSTTYLTCTDLASKPRRGGESPAINTLSHGFKYSARTAQ
jgi:hypothetical protein